MNLASRITAIARPASVLVDREFRDGTSEDYRWSYAGARAYVGSASPSRSTALGGPCRLESLPSCGLRVR